MMKSRRSYSSVLTKIMGMVRVVVIVVVMMGGEMDVDEL
jgi:hypothetical protein